MAPGAREAQVRAVQGRRADERARPDPADHPDRLMVSIHSDGILRLALGRLTGGDG